METSLTKKNSIHGFIVACVCVLTLTSCLTKNETNEQSLIVERQECLLKHFTHMTSEILPITVVIDVPLDGPQTLRDSVTAFLNETLYAYFDNGEDRHVPYENVFSNDVKQLLEHYYKAYSNFFIADTTDTHEFETDCLVISLVAQTDTYVTYEVNHILYGEGVETETEWVMFVKNDGHRLKKVISEHEMLRFYRENPELRSEEVWENLLNQTYDEDSLSDVVCSVGLLEDAVAHQYVYAPGIYEDSKYPLQAIAPYLSEEAQALIKHQIPK